MTKSEMELKKKKIYVLIKKFVTDPEISLECKKTALTWTALSMITELGDTREEMLAMIEEIRGYVLMAGTPGNKERIEREIERRLSKKN
jgi:hypothetical protein